MEKLKMQITSIRFSLILSICISIVAAQLLYMGSIKIVDSFMLNLMEPSPESFVFKDGQLIFINYSSDNPDVLPQISDVTAFETLKAVRSAAPIFIYGFCVVSTTILYYRVKLKHSFQVLTQGIEKISKQELNFSIHNQSKDELGQLCNAFDKMRDELDIAFKSLWLSEENQRSLYRAFAHDLRTPLTIVKGNNEIIEYVAAKNNNWEQALQAVALSNIAIKRIELYAEQLKQLETIDEWDLQLQKVNIVEFTHIIQNQACILANKYTKAVRLESDNLSVGHFDVNLVQRVLDNIIINALEHAKNSVSICVMQKDYELQFSIEDDGEGFSPEDLKSAFQPFYSSNKACGHVGIGLTICQKLLQKHGSSLLIENSSLGGYVKFLQHV